MYACTSPLVLLPYIADPGNERSCGLGPFHTISSITTIHPTQDTLVSEPAVPTVIRDSDQVFPIAHVTVDVRPCTRDSPRAVNALGSARIIFRAIYLHTFRCLRQARRCTVPTAALLILSCHSARRMHATCPIGPLLRIQSGWTSTFRAVEHAAREQ